MARVSVVIPARNDAECLRRCLEALAQQTRTADEVVVVDNASSDDTAAVARAAGALVVAEPRVGIPAAAATGFDAATGDIVARLDADSLPPPDWLERVEAQLSDSGTAVVTGPGEFYGSGPVVRWLGSQFYVGAYFRAMRLVLGHPPAFGSNFALRADVWEAVRDRVHRTVRTVHDDLDLSIQLEPHFPVVYDPSLVVGISSRPLASVSGFMRRAWWVVLTLRLNSRERSLLHRRARWRRAAGQNW